ncbi:hypothetical protein FEI14_15265 [Lacticaseibacillus zeae]|uniref:Uncharacterized protein n=1 Tax=Lacticaseibacillus zeae TaxID=57037 RepID=A0A5R8LK62_LACZE|nr:hypothetical protein FEI14_15265 [Lacticaseibacillus zeae]
MCPIAITRSPAQEPACKNLGRNGKDRLENIRPHSITRSPAQKPAHKDLEIKWPKPSHLISRPLMLRFLTAPARAHTKSRPPIPVAC